MPQINVILIEDNEVEAELIREEIQSYPEIGEIAHYSTAWEALNFLMEAEEENLPDLILLDLNLKFMDGFEFIDRIEESDRFAQDIPFKIYIITNSFMLRDREQFEKQYLATEFLEKPTIREVLSEKVKTDFEV